MKFIFGVTVTARSPKNLIIFLFLKGINARIPSVADSRIIGGSRPSLKGGGGGHPNPEKRGGPASKKCFGLSGLSFVKK